MPSPKLVPREMVRKWRTRFLEDHFDGLADEILGTLAEYCQQITASGTPGSLMSGRPDLNAWLGEFLAEHADAILGSAGFKRRAGARSARRKTGYGAQKIEFFAYSRSAYAPGQAHLVMKAWFYMPQVMQLARQLFGPSFTIDPADPGLAGGADLDSLRQREPLGL